MSMIVLFLFFVSHFQLNEFYAHFFLFATFTHVIGQQTGLAFALLKKTSFNLAAWKYLSILSFYMRYTVFSENKEYAHLIMFLGFLFLSIELLKSRHKQGMMYCLLLQGAFFSSVLFSYLNFFFLEVLVIRFIHDSTAFAFYITHNAGILVTRKFSLSTNKLLYASTFFGLIPIWAGTLFVAIFLNNVVILPNHGALKSILFLDFMVLLHYYTESFVWKKSSPLRKQVPL